MGRDRPDWAGGGLGVWLQVVEGLHRKLSDFIHGVVVHRREEAIQRWRNWLRADPLVHPYKWLRSDLIPPAPFFAVRSSHHSWVIRAGLTRNSEKLGFPTFCRSGQRETSLEELIVRLKGGYHFCRRCPCHGLLEMLADVVRRKGATAGSLDDWGWGGSSRLSRFLGLMVLLVFDLRWRILGFHLVLCWGFLVFGLRGCLMLALL